MDFTSLNQLIGQMTRTNKSAIRNRNKLHVTFLGYDEDPREVYEIPEIRLWFKESLKAGIPWFYILSPKFDGIAVMIFLYSCCRIKVKNKNSVETTIEIVNFDDVDYWVTTNFDNLNSFTEKSNINIEINKQVSELILNIVHSRLFGS